MIERLRKRFIRIATLAVAGVLLLLCVTVNAANYVSVDRQLTQMLRMICDNQGTVPHFPPGGGKPGQKPDVPFTPETPYSTLFRPALRRRRRSRAGGPDAHRRCVRG